MNGQPSPASQSDRQAQALALAAAGFALVPVEPGAKHPQQAILDALYGGRWASLRKRPACAAEINDWFARDPRLWIGVITGTPSGVLVVDVDRDEPASLRDLHTPWVRTPRGRHLYLAADGARPTTKHGFGEIIGDGSYVVALANDRTWLLAPPNLGEPLGAPEVQLAPASLLTEIVTPLRPTDLVSRAEVLVSGAEQAPHTTGVGVRPEADEAFARVIAAGLGLGFPRAHCPFHPDQRESGSFSQGGKRPGDWIYRCHACGETYSLPGLWIRAHHGIDPDSLRPASFSIWQRRAMIETGWAIVPETLRPLPAAFTNSRQAYWNGYRLLVRCQQLSRSGADSWPPYTHNFAASWCGLPRSTCGDARDVLMQTGWLCTTGETITCARGKAHRFKPGPAAYTTPTGEQQ